MGVMQRNPNLFVPCHAERSEASLMGIGLVEFDRHVMPVMLSAAKNLRS